MTYTEMIQTAFLAIIALFQALRFVAPKTATAVDDKMLEAANNGIVFVEKYAPLAYDIVRNMTAAGMLSKDGRLNEFMRQLDAVHEKVTGEKMSDEARTLAEFAAKGLHAGDKAKALEANAVIPADAKLPNPPEAPVSK